MCRSRCLRSHLDRPSCRNAGYARREYTSLPFRTPSLYSRIRHPLYVGWAIAFWATPTMTAGHLLFAAGMTAYMLIAIFFEERNLVEHFGSAYEAYRRRGPMFVPWRGRS